VTTEEKLAQLEKILNGRTLHGSESLKAFLRFVVEKTVGNGDGGLKEYIIATEVFGRNSDYNSRIDSVVRVQASRLRAKLHEYYITEGKSDQVVIDLPKGHYTPTFSYNSLEGVTNGSAEPAGLSSRTDRAYLSKLNFWMTVSLVAAVLLAALLGAMLWRVNSEKAARLTTAVEPESQVAAERQASLPLWGDLLSSPEPFLVVFSNTLFRGTAETGMKILKPLDAPGSPLGSAALPQQIDAAQKNGQGVTEHYTGIGEVMGIYFLGDFFARVKHPFRVKRSLLLNWEDLKSENIIVLGSPAENLFLRDLPQNQELIFRPLTDEQGRKTFGIVNTKPRPGEEKVYLARQDGPSRSQITEDYAVISLLQGLDARNRLFILAGITTLGTQAAAEYVSKPEYIKEMISSMNTAPAGMPARLPSAYQLLVKVKVTGGVPVHIAYVTHHVL
jgi:hypothetical protein